MKLYYIANARMPNEKGHGIQMAEMCDAFVKLGVDLTLVVPGRSVTSKDMQAFYALKQPIPLVSLQVPNFYLLGKVGFFVSSLFFMLRYLLFLLGKRFRGERFVIYTIDMDGFSSTFLPYLGTCVSEMHSAKHKTLATSLLFRKLHGVIATTSLTRDALAQAFSFPKERIIVEPNGVELDRFAHLPSKEDARQELSLAPSKKFAFYVGRFYGWKGLEILPQVCRELLSKGIECYVVGGTPEQFKDVTGESIPDNLHIMGAKSPNETPVWLAACDVALVLGTARNEGSFLYTSPMKVFEYMAAGVPIVASDTPALQDVVTTDEVYFYAHDSATSLAQVIEQSMAHSEEAALRVTRAYEKVQKHSLEARARRILNFCTSLEEHKV